MLKIYLIIILLLLKFFPNNLFAEIEYVNGILKDGDICEIPLQEVNSDDQIKANGESIYILSDGKLTRYIKIGKYIFVVRLTGCNASKEFGYGPYHSGNCYYRINLLNKYSIMYYEEYFNLESDKEFEKYMNRYKRYYPYDEWCIDGTNFGAIFYRTNNRYHIGIRQYVIKWEYVDMSKYGVTLLENKPIKRNKNYKQVLKAWLDEGCKLIST